MNSVRDSGGDIVEVTKDKVARWHESRWKVDWNLTKRFRCREHFDSNRLSFESSGSFIS